MSTTAPAMAASRRAPRTNFAEALGSEWTKILTVKSTFWTLLATVAVTIGLSALLAWAFSSSLEQLPAEDRAAFDPASFGLVGLNFGVITLGVLGVLVISSEYSTGMIRTSLTAVPRRTRLLAAKALVLLVTALIVGEIVSFASFFAGQAIFASKNLNASIGDDGMLRAVIGGGIYLALVALFAFGVGAIVRHTAGAITTVLGLLFVAPIFGGFLPGDWGRTAAKLLPSNAGSAIMATRDAPTILSPWTGFAVFAGYTAAVLLLAFVLFERRDA